MLDINKYKLKKTTKEVKMTKRLKKGDTVTFKGCATRWIVDAVFYCGEIVHLELENGGGPAYAIPTTSLTKV